VHDLNMFVSHEMVLDAENKRYVYDAENHATAFFKGTNSSQIADATYTFDGEGKRIKKETATEVTIFVYDGGGKLVVEYSTQISQTPHVSYLTADDLGSPRLITDEAGAVISRHDYTGFGVDVAESLGNVGGRTLLKGYGVDDKVRNQYTGYQRDDESGMDFAQARNYNSAHGRFTSVDPMIASASIKNPQTFNRYSYVLNSPYKFSDALGLMAEGSSGSGACEAQYSSCSDDYNIREARPPVADSQTGAAEPPIAASQTTQSPQPAATTPEPPPDGQSIVPVNGDWYTYDGSGQVPVSGAADQILDAGATLMTANILEAMGAVKWLEDNPKASSQLSLSVSLGGSVDVTSKGMPSAGGTVTGSVTVTTTVTSADSILSALGAANDGVQGDASLKGGQIFLIGGAPCFFCQRISLQTN